MRSSVTPARWHHRCRHPRSTPSRMAGPARPRRCRTGRRARTRVAVLQRGLSSAACVPIPDALTGGPAPSARGSIWVPAPAGPPGTTAAAAATRPMSTSEAAARHLPPTVPHRFPPCRYDLVRPGAWHAGRERSARPAAASRSDFDEPRYRRRRRARRRPLRGVTGRSLESVGLECGARRWSRPGGPAGAAGTRCSSCGRRRPAGGGIGDGHAGRARQPALPSRRPEYGPYGRFDTTAVGRARCA